MSKKLSRCCFILLDSISWLFPSGFFVVSFVFPCSQGQQINETRDKLDRDKAWTLLLMIGHNNTFPQPAFYKLEVVENYRMWSNPSNDLGFHQMLSIVIRCPQQSSNGNLFDGKMRLQLRSQDYWLFTFIQFLPTTGSVPPNYSN